MPRWHSLLRVAGHTLLIGVITFVLAELTCRVYQHVNPTFLFAERSYNRFRGKPGAPDYDFSLNARGFKDVEFPLTKTPNTYRILALGDSFAFGVVPYHANYLTLLEHHLQSRGLRTDVLNMGIPDIGPPEYLALFLNEGLALQSDMVLVSFFIGNDFTDSRRVRRTTLASLSHVVALLKYLLDLRRVSAGRVIHGRALYDDTAPGFTDAAYVELEARRSWIYTPQAPSTPAFANAVASLVRLKAVCDWGKIALRVVLIPDELQVTPALQAKVRTALNVSAQALDFRQPNRFLHVQLHAAHIAYLDLLDDFVTATTQQPLYRPNDTHWNIAGNALAAELLARYLASEIPPMTSATAETAGGPAGGNMREEAIAR